MYSKFFDWGIKLPYRAKAEIPMKFNLYAKLLDNGLSFIYVLYITINLW